MHTARLVAMNKAAEMALPSEVVIQRTFLIGRNPQCCNLVLEQDTVSRRHCCIEVMEDGVSITDSSRNGTDINGVRLSEKTILLQAGSHRIELCRGELIFKLLVTSRDIDDTKLDQFVTETMTIHLDNQQLDE